MGKVIFSIKYDIHPEKREEYLDVVRELKNLIKTEGLESYSVYEHKGKPNTFTEIQLFTNKEAWEDFNDDPDERTNILMNKLTEMIKQQSTEYTTLYEI